MLLRKQTYPHKTRQRRENSLTKQTFWWGRGDLHREPIETLPVYFPVNSSFLRALNV
jgi:hypothetical protein